MGYGRFCFSFISSVDVCGAVFYLLGCELRHKISIDMRTRRQIISVLLNYSLVTGWNALFMDLITKRHAHV